MSRCILGIDPGLDGALAVSEPDPSSNMVYDTPTFTKKVARGTKREYNLKLMSDWLLARRSYFADLHAFIENVHSMPGQGVRSMFSMGYGVGAWHGLLTAHAIPYTLVTPQSWKRVMLPPGADKDASRVRAAQLWADRAVLFERKKDDGRADAVLIAEYGRRTLGLL